MNVTIGQSKICGKVTPPSSKSVAHRALIAAFLSGGGCKIFGDLSANDISATMQSLRALGAEISEFDGGCDFGKIIKQERAKINVFESGSTLRFLLPLLPAIETKALVCGSERLANRPIGGLLKVLEAHGATFSDKKLPFEVGGKLIGGTFEIDGSTSSQYVTGLLLTLPILQAKSQVKVLGSVVSGGYIDLTLDVMRAFGVDVAKRNLTYFIDENATYRAPKTFFVESDWSAACFLLCLGALCGEVTVDGLNVDSRQGDKIVLDVLKNVGAAVDVNGASVTVKARELKSIEFDAENYPDFVPVLAALLACAKGRSRIFHVERLRDKESDRLGGVIELLKNFGISATYDGIAIEIQGGEPQSCVYHSPNDHRMAMSAAVLALRASGKSRILGAECVAKSYPNFFEHLKNIGGEICYD